MLGKLASALSWILLLLLASIPVTALVFTFGGVAPDDMVRGYLVLLVTAIFYGSLGLFVSALVKRTQAATVINLVAVIALTAGAGFLFVFWSTMTNNGFLPNGARDDSFVESLTRRPPEALLWFNPFIAQLDVVCGTETAFGGSCQIIGGVTNQEPVFNDNAGGFDQQFGVRRDSYWPRSLAAMTIASLVLIVLSVQLVSPTRRWRIRRPRPHALGPPGVMRDADDAEASSAAARTPDTAAPFVPADPATLGVALDPRLTRAARRARGAPAPAVVPACRPARLVRPGGRRRHRARARDRAAHVAAGAGTARRRGRAGRRAARPARARRPRPSVARRDGARGRRRGRLG